LTTGFTWRQVVEELEELCRTLHAQNVPTEEQIGCLEKLLSRCEIDAEMQALESDDQEIQKWRRHLVELVLEENVLLLTGTIEDYYPGASRKNKVERALEFDAEAVSIGELRSCFRPVFDGRTSDVEAFLHRVFGR
jgi:putative ATP-dependent endonuclease of OLD family